MKPKNFHGRVNDRRKGALRRLRNEPKNLAERQALEAKIMPDMVARSVRTKKDHSRLAKVGRNA